MENKSFFSDLTSQAHWLNRRNQELAEARRNMAFLMSDHILPGTTFTAKGVEVTIPAAVIRPALDRNDPVIVEANARYVARARKLHRIAMGRAPVCRHTEIRHGVIVSGLLYASGGHNA